MHTSGKIVIAQFENEFCQLNLANHVLCYEPSLSHKDGRQNLKLRLVVRPYPAQQGFALHVSSLTRAFECTTYMYVRTHNSPRAASAFL